MRSRLVFFVLVVGCVTPLLSQDVNKPTSVSVRKNSWVVLDVYFSVAVPDQASPYGNKNNWQVKWGADETSSLTTATVDAVEIGQNAIGLKLGGSLPPQATDAQTIFWNVSVSSLEIETSAINSAPQQTVQNCDDPGARKPFFCPPGPTDLPDFSLSGSLVTGGGTSPIYSLEAIGGILLPWRIPTINAYTGVKFQVEINQDAKPPSSRTRFDPDSISAGLAFTHISMFGQKSVAKGPLNGMRIQIQPGGEFSRSDPSSNFIVSALATLDFKPLGPAQNSPLYFTLYPIFGLEAGRNLNRPGTIAMTAVDLSRYKGIVRAVGGGDAKFALASEDAKSDVFSVTGAYRVRIPTIDEPFVETLHQITTVNLTTKARHWVEADIAYTIPTWKYLSFSATYQYGDLPPLFTLVDHKLTLGLKLQAIQVVKGLKAKIIQ